MSDVYDALFDGGVVASCRWARSDHDENAPLARWRPGQRFR
jgi:hypothetical protein